MSDINSTLIVVSEIRNDCRLPRACTVLIYNLLSEKWELNFKKQGEELDAAYEFTRLWGLLLGCLHYWCQLMQCGDEHCDIICCYRGFKPGYRSSICDILAGHNQTLQLVSRLANEHNLPLCLSYLLPIFHSMIPKSCCLYRPALLGTRAQGLVAVSMLSDGTAALLGDTGYFKAG